MELIKGKVYHGFEVIYKEEVEEIQGEVFQFQHLKSGAELVYVKNEDNNKVFTVTYKTPPENNKGIPHIVEHSVMSGSKKYPVKDLFSEILKSTMFTDIIIQTNYDYTIYGAATKNNKQLINFMDIFMDCTLNPKICWDSDVFKQEAGRYEIFNTYDDVNYKGVVYNEVKNTLMSPQGIQEFRCGEVLYPESIYRFKSGGISDEIMELKEEEFLNYHKKYYHPSNSYIYIYGNGDINESLKFLNEEYLSKFHRKETKTKIVMQKPLEKQREYTYEYPVLEKENLHNNSSLSLNYVIGDNLDSELRLAFKILNYILFKNETSPIKRNLLEKKIGGSVTSVYSDRKLQPHFSIIVEGCSQEDKNNFKEVVYNTLKDIVEEGLDKTLIEASLDYFEFITREADYGKLAKGLEYNREMLLSWLYGGNPTIHLKFNKVFEKIRCTIDKRYFENIIEKYLLNNTHSAVITINPSLTLGEHMSDEHNKNLIKFKENLSNQEIQELIKENIELSKRQNTPDSEENLIKMPVLSIEDIQKKAEVLPLVEKELENIKVLYHQLNTNGIVYLSMYFDLRTVPQELIPYAGVISNIVGQMDTKKYDSSTLSNIISRFTGGLNSYIDVFTEKNKIEAFNPKLVITSKVDKDNLDKLFQIMDESINNIVFKRDKIKKLVLNLKAKMKKAMERTWGRVPARLESYLLPAGEYKERVSGYEFNNFLRDISCNIDEKIDMIIDKLEFVAKRVFNKKNLIMSITCDSSSYNVFENEAKTLIDKINEEVFDSEKINFTQWAKNEAFVLPYDVQFVGKCSNIFKEGYEYSGKLKVIGTILYNEYFWNKIRIQGGAYDSIIDFNRNGNVILISCEDPNLEETFEVFSKTSEYLKSFYVSEREMTKYIIGTIGMEDVNLSSSLIGKMADETYFCNITEEDIQRERNEILSTTCEDVQEFSEVLNEIMKNSCCTVFGNGNRINECKERFDSIIK